MTAPDVQRWREMAEAVDATKTELDRAAVEDPYGMEHRKADDAHHAAKDELAKEALTAIPALARMVEEREAALEDAKWAFARIAQMHSIDDRSPEVVADRCMDEAQAALEKVRAALGRAG